MRDAHRRLHFVDVLPAFAARTERIHLQVLRPDVDLDLVVNFRNHEHRRKRRMPPRRLIERRNPHQPVHSRFSREQPISVFAAELHCGVLNARLFSRRFVQHRRAHSLSFRPAQIHPQKDGRPILRLRPSRTGLDRHDGVQMIVFSRKQRLRFQFRDVVFRRRQLFIEVLQQLVLLFGVGFFLRQMNICLNVSGDGRELFIRGHLLFGTLPLAQHALGGFLIAPETGFSDAGFQRLQAFAVARCVKDNSAQARCAASVLRSNVAGLRGSFFSFRAFSLLHYVFTSLLPDFKEVINRITETITHIQANQSPNRV